MKKLSLKTLKKLVTDKYFVYTGCAFAAFILFSKAYAVDPAAGSIEGQIQSFGELIMGPVAKYGVGGATIAGTIFAAVQFSMKAALSIMCIGLMLSYYLSWVRGGNFGVALGGV